MQLPMGRALDLLGPRRVLLALMTLAVLGCAAFALAPGLGALIAARALIGVGVSACLMAPMTAYRLRFGTTGQLQANSWMLMTGSLGMVASTLPVQWLLPAIGWRGLVGVGAAMVALAMIAIARGVPRDVPVDRAAAPVAGPAPGYAEVPRHAVFVAYAPLGFFAYGGMIAVQALRVGPWLTQVAGATALESAQALLGLNLAMLVAFLAWGSVAPRLHAGGWDAPRLIAWGAPASLAVLCAAIALGPITGALTWTLYCVSTTVLALSLQHVGMAFPRALAGRALSAYNVIVFAGVFALQWGIGGAIDALRAAGADTLSAYRAAFALWAACCIAADLWFLARRPKA